MYAVRPSAHRAARGGTHQPAKIYGYEFSVAGGPGPLPLDVYIYNQTLSYLASELSEVGVGLALFMADEGDLWVLQIDRPSKIHPTEAVNHVPLPALGYCVRVAGHGELEGCVRDITRPLVSVPPNLIMHCFVRRARGVQLAQRPGQKEDLHTGGE